MYEMVSGQLCTVLSELGGGELRGDPEVLLGAALEDEAGGDAGAAVEVLLAAGQTQVEGVVTEGGVLIALRTNNGTCYCTRCSAEKGPAWTPLVRR